MRITELLDIKNFLSFVSQSINQIDINITNCKTNIYLSSVNKITGEIIDDYLKLVTDEFDINEKYIMFYDSDTKINIPVKRINNMLLYNIGVIDYIYLKWNDLYTKSDFITDIKELYNLTTTKYGYRYFILDKDLIHQLYMDIMFKDSIESNYFEFIRNNSNLTTIYLEQIKPTNIYLPHAIQSNISEDFIKYQPIVEHKYILYFAESMIDEKLYKNIVQTIKQNIIKYLYENQILNYFDYLTIIHAFYEYHNSLEHIVTLSIKLSFNYFNELLYIQYCKDVINNM